MVFINCKSTIDRNLSAPKRGENCPETDHLHTAKPKRDPMAARKEDREAPYVMQAANELKVHLGWAVQIYNAAEALPNLINPFWMLPLLGVLGLRARDVVGFTFLQLLLHLPIVLFLLWALAYTLEYHPPVVP